MIHTFHIDPGTPKIRADKWLSGQLQDLSRSLIQKTFEEGLVKVNGIVADKSVKLTGGDVVEFQLMEVKPLDLDPQDIPLKVLYEDEYMLALDKASGMVVHPGAGTTDATLVHALLHHCRGQLSGIGGIERPGIVHRLDRETTGVIVVAKTDAAHRAMAEAFATRTLSKEYLALVAGVPDRLSGSIIKPIGRHQNYRHKMTVRDDGKAAHTDWELLGKCGEGVSLLLCEIHSGRTHQIRIHLSDMGFPILGDAIYGYRAQQMDLPVEPERVMLHAWRLSLKHPVTGALLKLEAFPPPDFLSIHPDIEPLVRRAGS